MNVIISKIASVSLHRSMSGSQRTCWVSNESLSSDRWNVLFLRGRLWRALPVWGRKYWNINIRFYISFSLLKELKRRAQKAVDALNNDQHKHICLWKWRESPPGSSLPSPPAGDQSDLKSHDTVISVTSDWKLWEKFTHPPCVSVLDEGVFVGLTATRAGLSCCVFACVEVVEPQAVNSWHKAGWSRNSRSRHVLILPSECCHVSTSGVKRAEPVNRSLSFLFSAEWVPPSGVCSCCSPVSCAVCSEKLFCNLPPFMCILKC